MTKNEQTLEYRLAVLLLDIFLSNPDKRRFPLGQLERRIGDFIRKEKRKWLMWSLLVIVILSCGHIISSLRNDKGDVYRNALKECTALGGRLVMQEENNVLVTTCDTIEVITEASTLSGDCSREREFIKKYIREDYMRKVTGLGR